MNDIKHNIMEAIQKGAVPMHSRLRFIVHSILSVGGLIFLFGVGLFLVSFIVFLLRANGLLSVAHFGYDGFGTIFFGLPWLILLSAIAVIVMLEILATHFSFSYRRPLIYSIVGSGVIVVFGGVLIAYSTLHEQIFRFNESRPLPGIAQMYGQALYTPEGVFVGIVSTSSSAFFDIESRGGSTTRIMLVERTRKPPVMIGAGDSVVVMTKKENGVITAIGIRPLERERALFPRKHKDPCLMQAGKNLREKCEIK